MVDWGGLSDDFRNICRLCLQNDDFIVNIFHRLDPNSQRKPLPDRIYDLFQVKVTKDDNLPTNICHRCLYFTESFTEFRDNVRKCEARLQRYTASVGILGSLQIKLFSPKSGGIKLEKFDGTDDYIQKLSEENDFVTVVDPDQDYDSSNDGCTIDSDNDYALSVSKNLNGNKKENSENSDNIKNVFMCKYCDMAFTTQVKCVEHEIGHDIDNPHSCNYCRFSCSSRQTVIAHIREVHGNNRPYVCVQCKKGFGRRSDLKKHTIVHTGIRPYTCQVCNKSFSRNTNLTKHLRIHTGLKPHVCQKCPRSFTTVADLIRHQRVHSDCKPFQCTKCPSAFARKDKLLHHQKVHMRKNRSKNKTSSSASDFRTNSNDGGEFDGENMVISLNPFTDMNQSEEYLQMNQKNMKSTQPILAMSTEVSEINCNFSIPLTHENIGSNSSAHHNISEVSANAFKKPRNRVHICLICSKTFSRKRELQRHSVIHTGMKPFSCKVCNKKFNRKDKVVRHERIHADETKLSCSICHMQYSKQETHDLHMKLHECDKTPFEENNRSIVSPQKYSFAHSLHEEIKPQLNFYSEIKPDLLEG